MSAKRLWELAAYEPDTFASMCERLRKLGVAKLGPLVLGEMPIERSARPKTAELSPQERMERHFAVQFAASSIRPPLPKIEENLNGLPRAVVQRRQAQEARRGGTDEADS